MPNKLAAVDFETFGIKHRPEYPPKPVGVAIFVEGQKPEYLAWGHPAENNCTKAQAGKKLREIWKNCIPVFHNMPFDCEVALKFFRLPLPKQFHDTQVEAYLIDPRMRSLSLKPLADQWLNMPPDEQTQLRDWILTNVAAARGNPKQWGAYIAHAPGKLVGRYAVGDVVRTMKLHKLFNQQIREAQMERAYERELRVLPIKIKMEQEGLAVSKSLSRDMKKWEKAQQIVDSKIRKRLKVDSSMNLGSSAQLAAVLVKRGLLSHVVKTRTGRVSTKRAILEETCTDKKLTQLLAMHSVLSTYNSTFLLPWHFALNKHGRVYPTFNTVRSTDEYGGKSGVGTKTGRFSSSNPNFQNIPANIMESKHRETLLALQKFLKEEVALKFTGLRSYIVPDEGWVFIGRDYSQQELRILAHFENNVLLKAYLEDSKIDVHEFVRQMVHNIIGVLYPRRYIKDTNFGLIYGMGVMKLAGGLNISVDEATTLKNAVLAALPGVKTLNRELKKLAKNKEPMYTWGERRYYCEEDSWHTDEQTGEEMRRRWDYKMLNLLIQGSAADNTKEAMIQVEERCSSDYFKQKVQVHDELLGMALKGHEREQMAIMKDAMEDVEFSVPMLTEGKKSARSWGDMKPCK